MCESTDASRGGERESESLSETPVILRSCSTKAYSHRTHCLYLLGFVMAAPLSKQISVNKRVNTHGFSHGLIHTHTHTHTYDIVLSLSTGSQADSVNLPHDVSDVTSWFPHTTGFSSFIMISPKRLYWRSWHSFVIEPPPAAVNRDNKVNGPNSVQTFLKLLSTWCLFRHVLFFVW